MPRIGVELGERAISASSKSLALHDRRRLGRRRGRPRSSTWPAGARSAHFDVTHVPAISARRSRRGTTNPVPFSGCRTCVAVEGADDGRRRGVRNLAAPARHGRFDRAQQRAAAHAGIGEDHRRASG